MFIASFRFYGFKDTITFYLQIFIYLTICFPSTRIIYLYHPFKYLFNQLYPYLSTIYEYIYLGPPAQPWNPCDRCEHDPWCPGQAEHLHQESNGEQRGWVG